MLKRFFRKCLLAGAVIVYGTACLAAGVSAQSPGTATQNPQDQDRSVSIQAQRPAGITGDGARLWVLDGATAEILELRPDSGEILRRFALGLQEPKGLAFDGTLLWTADPAARQIHGFDAASGQRVKTLPIQVPPEKGYRSVEALAWDGQHLWTAIAAGFSSSYNQIDRDSGQIVRSLFADCDPRGLAVNAGRLWSLCFNGERHPPLVDQRELSPEESAIVRSRRFLRPTAGRNPSGLFFDGQFLWALDGTTKQATRFLPIEQRKPQEPTHR
jgi:hypothetical protein